MFKDAKDFVKDKGLLSFISFKDGKEHIVELVKCKRDMITGQDGKEIDGVKWLVKENEEPKSFFTSSPALVNTLAEYSVGDIVKIKLKKVKTAEGFRSSYSVKLEEEGDEGEEEEEDAEIDVDDIPFS